MAWNRLQDLMLLQERMNRLFEEATERRQKTVDPERGAQLEEADWSPASDVYQSDAEYIIETDLPGIDKSLLEITLDDNRLVIRGSRDLDHAQAARSERPNGRFFRTFTLPSSADQKGIRAEYKNGVLQIRIPRQTSYGERVEIKVT